MEILDLIGFQVVEPLTTFCNSWGIEIPTNPNLENVWLAQKSEKRNELKNIDPKSLMHCSPKSCPLPSFSQEYKAFSPGQVVQDVIDNIKPNRLISYIFEDCYLLQRWSNGSFEPVVDCDLNTRIAAFVNSKSKKRIRPIEAIAQENVPKKCRASSPDLFKEDEEKLTRKHAKRTRRLRRKGEKISVGGSTPKPVAQDTNECVFLDHILYDCKLRSTMLAATSAQGLLENIIRVQLGFRVGMLDEWLRISPEWTKFNQIVEQFVQREATLSHSHGYERVLTKHLKRTRKQERTLSPISKECIVAYICDVLRRVLPPELFGNKNRPKKRLFSAVKQLIYGAKFQKFPLQEFLNCFKTFLPWREQLAPAFQRLLPLKFTKFLVTEYILKILRNLFFITECGSSGFELFYYQKSDVESFCTRKVNALIETGKITPVQVEDEDNSLERRWLENRHQNDTEDWCKMRPGFMPEESKHRQPAGKLRFLPKSADSGELRTISISAKAQDPSPLWNRYIERQLERKKNLSSVKRFLDAILSCFSTGILPLYSNPDLAEAWKRVTDLKKGRQLYFVKADITDAYGSVNHKKLLKVFDSASSRSGKPKRELELREWVLRRGQLQLTTRRSFSRKIGRNRILHSRSKLQYQDPKLLREIIKQTIDQRLWICGKLYRVTAGLCQGGVGPLSTRLCDLYYSGLDMRYFKALTEEQDAILLRGMDDYLFVTVDLSKAVKFHSMVLAGIDDNTQFSTKKLLTNIYLSCPSFTYLGLNFNIETLTVEPNYERYKDSSMLNFIKLNIAAEDPVQKREQFFTQRTLQANMLKLVPIVFCSLVDDIRTKRQVLVEACRLQANKAVALALLLRPRAHVLQMVLYKAKAKVARISFQLPRQELDYVYWQCIYAAFFRHCGCFQGLSEFLKVKLIRLCGHFLKEPLAFALMHADVEEAFAKAALQWWRPWQ